MTTTESTTRAPLDSVCAAAVELAREALLTEIPADAVGAHVAVESDAERVVTQLFECLDPAYGGWRWGVQLVRSSRAKEPTVNGVYLLPGPDSLLAPPWVPWSERLRPGDLGVGDLLPAAPDDDRLVLSLEDTDSDAPLIEWGLGRPRVLSAEGRLEAAERWYDGDAGPDTPHAKHAPAPCGTCGFFVPLSGGLGLGFGACANEFSPDDGRVVAVDHGCGAHSEGSPEVAEMGPAPALVDEFTFELVPADDETTEPAEAEQSAAGDGGDPAPAVPAAEEA